MFLTRVYHYNKWLFCLLLLFAIAQLFVFYKRGLVVTPFYNYGMYSDAFKINSDYPVFEVSVDGKLLQGKDYSPQEWDKIFLPVQYYSNIKNSNSLYYSDISRLLQKTGISSSEVHFIQKCNYSSFEAWYKNYLQSLLKKKVNTLSITRRNYSFSQRKLIKTDSVILLQQLCQ